MEKILDNKILYAVLTILFNHIGVPCFIQGKIKDGIIRIVLCVVTCGILGTVNMIIGIINGIKIFQMSDEEYAAKKSELLFGIPAVK